MKIWFTSDTHYGHANVIKYSNRPFSNAEEMDEYMIKEWNKRVQQGDVAYHLGDVAFSKGDRIKSILQRLNGNKHLILGNHDKTIRNNQPDFLNDRLFRSIQDFKEISIDGTKVVLCHYGMRVWNKSHYGSIQLYGHSHGNLPPHGKSVDVGVDAPFVTGKPEYAPISWGQVKKWADSQELKNVDHHNDS